jgi:hypothetical protein
MNAYPDTPQPNLPASSLPPSGVCSGSAWTDRCFTLLRGVRTLLEGAFVCAFVFMAVTLISVLVQCSV